MTAPLSDAQLAAITAGREAVRSRFASGAIPYTIGQGFADELADAAMAPLLAELERERGESMFWHFEYREAMDNYRGERDHAKKLRAELTNPGPCDCWPAYERSEHCPIYPASAPTDDLLRCSAAPCPSGVQYALAQERGWTAGEMSGWYCPEHTTMEATATADPLCRRGHRKDQHQNSTGLGGAQCLVCPGDSERSWRHPYTPEES